MKENLALKIIGYILVTSSLLAALWLACNIELLVSDGYALVAGPVVSRTLLIIFVLFCISQLGYHLIKK